MIDLAGGQVHACRYSLNAFFCGTSLVSDKHVVSGDICKLNVEVKSEFIDISQPRTASRPVGHLKIDNHTKKFSNLR
jgi:hypothetical protein